MKAKPVILVIITLIIGFVIGMLTSAQLRLHRLKPVRLYFSEERFREGFYNVIQPDEDQRARIEVILDKYAKINAGLQSDFRKELENNMRTFRKELDANLTKEQIARLREMDQRREEMMRQERRFQRSDSTRFRDGRDPDFDRRRMRDDGPQPPGRYQRRDTAGTSAGE